MAEKRRFGFTNLFRRTTPKKPYDRKVYNVGIQEREQSYMMTAPLVYSVVQQSVIVRTCITQLKQEVFRRGYVWKRPLNQSVNLAKRLTKDLSKNALDVALLI